MALGQVIYGSVIMHRARKGIVRRNRNELDIVNGGSKPSYSSDGPPDYEFQMVSNASSMPSRYGAAGLSSGGHSSFESYGDDELGKNEKKN